MTDPSDAAAPEPGQPRPPEPGEPRSRGGRGCVRGLATSRPLTLALLAAGGLLGVVASAQPWWRAVGGDAKVAFTGTEASGGLSQALALVALAGTLLVLALQVRGRRLVALVLLAVGLGQVVVGALRLRPTGDAVRTKLREVSLIDSYALQPTAWPWVSAVAGAVLTTGAVLLLLGAARWAVRTDRFQRVAPAAVDPGADDPARVWRALDAGIDPTAGPGEPAARARSTPDVHIGAIRDTMDRTTQPVQGTANAIERPARAATSPVSE